MKKYTKKIVIGIIGCIFLYTLLFRAIDFESTFIKTEYVNIEGTDKKIISTPYFDIETPRDWYFIDKGFGMDSFIGTFWTGTNFLSYDYGEYGCEYDSLYCEIYGLKHTRDTIDGLIVDVGQDFWEFGFYVPKAKISFHSLITTVDYKEIVRGLAKRNNW
jgi:hypothetical protein